MPTSAAASASRQHNVGGTSALSQTLTETWPRQEGRSASFPPIKVNKCERFFEPRFWPLNGFEHLDMGYF